MKKGAGPLNPLAVQATGEACSKGAGATTMAAHFFVCISVVRSSNQWSEPGSPVFGGQGPFCWCQLQQAAPEAHAQVPAEWLEVGGRELLPLRAEINHIYLPSLPWQLQAFRRFQSSKELLVTSDRVSQCSCCVGGETDPWYLLLGYLLEPSVYFEIISSCQIVASPSATYEGLCECYYNI